MSSHHLKTENCSSWTLGENPINEKESSDNLGFVGSYVVAHLNVRKM